MPENTPYLSILFFFLALFIASSLLLGWLLLPFASIIVMAFVVTGVFRPVYRFLGKRIKASLASFITCFLVILVLFAPITFFVGMLSNEALNMYQMAKSAVLSDEIRNFLQNSRYLEQSNQFLSVFNIEITEEDFNGVVSAVARNVGLFLYQQASSIASNILSFVVNFLFMLLIVFYLFIDGDRLESFIMDLSPLPEEQDQKLINKFREMAGAIIVGNGLGGILQGFLGGAVFALFQLPSAFLWGVIMGLLAFLPIVGIGMVFVPAAIFLFIQGRIGAGIFFIVFYAILSLSVEYIFKPKLVGTRLQMHPLLVFFSIVGGLKLFGLLGIIYGPLIVTAFLTLTDIYHASYQAVVEHINK